MTDATLNIADLIASGEEELVFDDDATIAAIPPAPASDPTPPRRAPRRGRSAVGKDAGPKGETAREADAPAPAPAPPASSAAVPPAPEVQQASAAATPAATEEPAGSPAPVPQPDVGPAGFDRRSALLLAIVILALFTSLLSLGGLIAVGRTLAHAEADRARAEDERSALVRVPAIVKALDDASTRLTVIAARTPGGPPATTDDLKRALDDLRLSLAQHQPDGMAPLTGMTRDGFAEVGTRLDRISSQITGVRAAPVPSRPLPPTGE